MLTIRDGMVTQIPKLQWPGELRSVSIAPNAAFVAAVVGRTALVWDAITGELRAAGVGFEPTNDREAVNGFQDRPVRPLRHPAEPAFYERTEAVSGTRSTCPATRNAANGLGQ